jgi:CubicO group peptidase (beta-lactamase class C family)
VPNLLLIIVVLAALNLASRAFAADAPATTQSAPPPTGSPEAMQLFFSQKMIARPFCFTGAEFPACDFENPDLVEKLIGAYTVSTNYYDASGKKVDRPAGPGRYAAVIEIHWGNQRVSRRFLTLFKTNMIPKDADVSDPMAWIKAAGDVDDPILKSHSQFDKLIARLGVQGLATHAGGAILLAGFYDLTESARAGNAVSGDPVDYLDRQWWVDFKRTFYGYDKIYPNAFVCPRPIDGPAAPVVRDGSLADAGMKPDTIATIDAAAEAWVKDVKIGFNFCVVRHGVVVLNKGYGLQAFGPTPDAPYTAQTAGPLASTTKFLSSLLLLEMVDQGLVDLDQPFEKYLPPMRDLGVKTPLTIREGYLHLGGFPDHTGDEMPDFEEVVADLYPSLNVGAAFKYEGNSLALGGKIMENISGESLPELYRKHLFDPLGCKDTQANFTSYGSESTPMDLARIGQMALNGGAYGSLRFFSPATLAKMMPIPGKDRLDPKDPSIRWGVGIKQFDIDGFSEKAFGHPGATGSCLVIDPAHDLVVAMTRFEEGGRFVDFLKKKSVIYKAVLESIDADDGK